jgi:hypothetical protein
MKFFREHVLGISLAIATGVVGTFLYDYFELKPQRTFFSLPTASAPVNKPAPASPPEIPPAREPVPIAVPTKPRPAVAASHVLQPGPADGQDIWTTSVYSYAPGGGGPGGGLADEVLIVGGWGDSYHTLLRFNLTTAPRKAQRATLELYCFKQKGAGAVQMHLDRVTSDWDWKVNGSGPDRLRLWWADRPSASRWSADPLQPCIVGEWYRIDLTALYNAWQASTYPNYGVQLRPVSTKNAWNEFHSSRYLAQPRLRPRLVIEN